MLSLCRLVACLCLLATAAAAQDAATYAANCASCHQADGQGVPHSIPALAGHAPSLLVPPGGRDYLARLVLYGLEGPIRAGGAIYDSAMPPWGATLSDAQLAGALDFALHSWGNDQALPAGFQPITPADIAAARATPMTAQQVAALRTRLLPDAAVPESALAPPDFTREQADRGHALYRRACQNCHGSNLDNGQFGGAPLVGSYFARHWGEGTLAALYGYLRARMPPDRPGRLSEESDADLVAFLLERNGYQPTSADLPTDPAAQERMSLKR